MKKKMTNKLDEMQEQKMLRIESNGCWLAFWGLLAVLFIQVIIYGYEGYRDGSWRYMAGEWIVFMCLALYITIDCIRNGIWDRRLSPTPIVNVCASAIAGVAVGVLNFIVSYRNYHMPVGAIVRGVFAGILVFVLCFAGLTCCTFLYKKRVNRLEQEDMDKEENK